MAAILLGYFGTMVTVFAAGLFFLASILDTATVRHARPEAHRVTAAARAMAAERVASSLPAQTEVAQLQLAVLAAPSARPSDAAVAANDGSTRAAAKQTQKAKQLKLARDQRRRERLASQHLDRSNTTAALGYAPETPTRTAAERIFNTIRSRR